MKKLEGQKIIVVGAGVAGLTAADQLASQGAEVTIIEREKEIGGLARSIRHQGVTFDIGPHRFHTDDKGVEYFIKDVLGPNQRIINRTSAVWLYNSYHDWPLSRSSLLKLPPFIMLQASFDLFRRPQPQGEDLENYVLSRYGQTLYDIFFRPYTEKFLTYKCSELHKDWASAGINRAVIDKRYKFDSLFHVARTTLLPPPVQTQFIYPRTDGIDRFSEQLGERIIQKGGKIFTDAPVSHLTRNEDTVIKIQFGDSEEKEFDHLLWTAPLPLLLQLLDMPPTGLRYLSELIFNFVLSGDPTLPYQWTYYGGAALSFMRASIPSHFNPENSRPGVHGVCLEVVCQEDDELWKNPALLRRNLEHDLLRVGLARRRDDILGMTVDRIKEAYPIYAIDYAIKLERAVNQVNVLKNILLLGRTGTFWYNNMDHSILQALELVEALRSGITPQQWNTDLKTKRAL